MTEEERKLVRKIKIALGYPTEGPLTDEQKAKLRSSMLDTELLWSLQDDDKEEDVAQKMPHHGAPADAPIQAKDPTPKTQLFETDMSGRIVEIPITDLDPFPPELHHFKPYSPERLESMVESIRQNGILQPLILRTLGNRYQIIAGHNRWTAAKQLAYTTVPAIVRVLNDDEALMQMITTNLEQRENLLPSEKAWAYRSQMEILSRQGRRNDLTSGQVGPKLTADDISETDSARQVKRFIRLTFLIPEFLEMVDSGKLPMTPAVSISFLTSDSQHSVLTFFFDADDPKPLKADTAEQLRTLEKEHGTLTSEMLKEYLFPDVKKEAKPLSKVTVKLKKLSKRIPASMTETELTTLIEELLTKYFDGLEDEPHV